jgi:L-ribulose-5-phosphate 4-epimerase
MVITKLGGQIVEGELRPSSDLPTHLEVCKPFANFGGVAHSHSESAHGEVPVTRRLPPVVIASDYYGQEKAQ